MCIPPGKILGTPLPTWFLAPIEGLKLPTQVRESNSRAVPMRYTMRLASAVTKAPSARYCTSRPVASRAKLDVKGRRITIPCNMKNLKIFDGHHGKHKQLLVPIPISIDRFVNKFVK
jgi:hypothetical protein